MNVTRYDNARDFYVRSESLWMRNEAAECMNIGITNALIEQWDRYSDDNYLATVEDDGGKVVLTAIRTPPRNLILSLTDRYDALDSLVEHLHATYGTLTGVMAEVEVGRQFSEKWVALTNTTYRLGMPEQIYRLEKIKPVSGVSGHARHVTPKDRDQVVDWIIDFEVEAFGKADPVARERREIWFDAVFEQPSRGLYVWEDNGVGVSMAGHQGPTPNGMRIGPVYTPPDKRGHGYASALTAHISQTLLNTGRKFCFLFTDLRNLTSNKIYQQICYEPVIECAVYEFTA
jgi:uncharacterized protein